MQQLRIIDTLSPFCLQNDQRLINWSKIDFSNIETHVALTGKTQRLIVSRFEAYLEEAAALGFNAISIDDLAHMVAHLFYDPPLRARLAQYEQLYKKLFSIARTKGFDIFINTDYVFHNPAIDRHLAQTSTTVETFFVSTLETLFRLFPEVKGIILRIGEQDGVDVAGDFLSRLEIQTPQQARRVLTALLAVCERAEKTLIFRTWTVGAHKIGDLIWNPATFDKIFSSIDSNSLVISLKFGDTDFMRNLVLNPLFFRTDHKKIIEVQTRREWEGMGQYPSFVGWDYARYFARLRKSPDVIGMHVWCQTGGWAKNTWSNTTFLDNASFWNELNTFVTAQLFNKHVSVEDAIIAFCAQRHIANPAKFIELLRLAEQAIHEGLYIREYAEQALYLRRTRLPTLFWIAWDTILLDRMALTILRTYIQHPERAVQEGHDAAKAISRMIELAKELRLSPPVLASLAFQHDTFLLLAEVRACIFAPGPNQNDVARLKKQYARYQKQYPQHYTLRVQALDGIARSPSRLVQRVIAILLRRTPAYRALDKVMLFTSPLQRMIARQYFKKSTPLLTKQSMGIETIFK